MKSQISIEFLAGVSLLLMIYIVAISFFSNYTQTVLVEGETGKQICYKIATTIDSAVVGGSNFTINTTIPGKIYGKNYTFYVRSNEVKTDITIVWNDRMTSCNIPSLYEIEDVSFSPPCKLSIKNTGTNILISCFD